MTRRPGPATRSSRLFAAKTPARAFALVLLAPSVLAVGLRAGPRRGAERTRGRARSSSVAIWSWTRRRPDSAFADTYHSGKPTDDQHQVVAQRLATVATRFARGKRSGSTMAWRAIGDGS